jgi:c-di-GMP-binding flagellar brake protein YcgR
LFRIKKGEKMDRKKLKVVEKRKFQRLEVPLDITIKVITDEEVPGGVRPLKLKSHDISLEGISLETRNIVIDSVDILSGSPGARENFLDMEIYLSPGEAPLQAIGEVCWYDVLRGSEEFMYQVGVVFVKIEDRGKKQLKEFLKSRDKTPNFFKKLFGQT